MGLRLRDRASSIRSGIAISMVKFLVTDEVLLYVVLTLSFIGILII
jgi:hypothetical protein